ncbi:flagellar basal-body MS-ring/collar protein FliF [Burkholderia sp. BE17]|uniref:flagellar basal-body MS-ring/collar protein FliF n=1 Tax=Burkholderia sp. BE17 TaxID=2656644 RepID=UPI0014065FE2|nr:flagellar basal-body MS-ring/collar protein FliF [Burkholderia sp. BE17]MPV70235.1 flagellar M-ring protein FliF [Burkholderia sp. BE17]
MLAQIKALIARLKPEGGFRLPSSAALSRLVPIVILAISLTALAMMLMYRQDSRYKPLFGTQESVTVSDMMAALDAEGIPYRIHPDSGQVLVPEQKLGVARMLLAAKGVVAKLPEGLEQVDRSDPLGVSQFVQDVRFRRGLEGELTKSMVALDPVASARVHLSIAKSTSFILADGDKSSASVVLTLKPNRKLSKEQVTAIVALVAGSVANLDPARVTVVDQAGKYLSAQIEPVLGASALDSELGEQMREQTLRNIRELLTPVLGEGNFRASVAVELDHDRVEETHEQYGEAPKVTQEAIRDERDIGQAALGVPGSLSNRPAPPSAASAPEAPHSAKNAQTRQYAYDRNVVQIKRSPVRVKRLNVAVVLNNATAPGDGKAWAPDQLAQVDKILRNGLGIDADRDDALVVSSLDFRSTPVAASLAWWRQPDNIVTIGTWVVWALGALLGFLFVFRPLLKVLRTWASGGRDPRAHTANAASGDSGGNVPVISRDADTQPLLLADANLPPIGSDVDVLIEHLKHLAGQDPERVAEVIKPWIRDDEHTN